MSTNEEYQGYFADCYVLSDRRTADFIENFLNTFVPNRKEMVDEFEVPQYSDNPFKIFKTSSEIIQFLIQNKTFKHTIYWENSRVSDLKGVELFFTDDGNVIFGIYCETKYPNTTIEDGFFSELKKFCQSNEGYITYEDTPPQNSQDFRKRLIRLI